MKKAFFLCLLLLGSLSIHAQRGTYKKKGNCFCDAAAKEGLGIYFRINGQAELFSFANFPHLQNKTAISPGLQIGIPISKRAAFETGVRYLSLKHIGHPDEQNTSDFFDLQFIDIPIGLRFRFPNENNGLMPYVWLGGLNSILLQKNQTSNGSSENQLTLNEKGYYDFFIQAKGGVEKVLSNNISFFGGLVVKQNLRNWNNLGDDNHLNFSRTFGVECGINFHF